MEENFGTKELYDISLKATFPMRIGNREMEEDETIIHFDKAEIATLDTITSRVAAVGGFDNRPQVIWEQTRQVNFTLRKGVLSHTSWVLLSNSKIFETPANSDPEKISYRETLESDENGKIELKYVPYKLFLYDIAGNKIKDYTLENNIITLSNPYTTVIADYIFKYNNEAYKVLKIGNKLLQGYLKLEGKIEIKDDKDGLEKTGILKIPKITLASDLSIRLGTEAQPLVGTIDLIGFPVGSRGNSSVCSITFLEENLRSDI